MKRRFHLLVTLTLALSVLTAVWTPVFAGDSSSTTGSTSSERPGIRPGAQPATGEPDAGGTQAPVPNPTVQRLGQLIQQQGVPASVVWQMILQWLLDDANVHPRGRVH